MYEPIIGKNPTIHDRELDTCAVLVANLLKLVKLTATSVI